MSRKEGVYLLIRFFLVAIAIVLILVSIYTIILLLASKGNAWIGMGGIAIGAFIISLIWMNYLTHKSKKEAKELSLAKNIIGEIEEEIKELKFGNRNKNEKIKEERIKQLIGFLKLLSKKVEEVDCLKDIGEAEIEELKGATCDQQFKEKKKELVKKLKSLKECVDLISTKLPSGDKLSLLKEIEKNITDIDERLNELKEKTDDDSKKEKKEKTDELIKLRNKKIELLSEEPVGVLDKHEIRRSLTISLTIVFFMLLFFTVLGPPTTTTTTQVLNMTNITGNITDNIPLKGVRIMGSETNITLTNQTTLISETTSTNQTTTPSTPNLQSPFLELFTYVYLAVITFYFGSRVLEQYIAKKK